MTFQEALGKLAKIGIRRQQVYLIDLALLCEMAWADGKIQQGELEIALNYLEQHVQSINRLAGCKVLTREEAEEFLMYHLTEKPDEHFQVIREVIAAIRITDKDPVEVENTRTDILNACLDIAASSVTHYPFGLCERFTSEEKRCYHEIATILQGA